MKGEDNPPIANEKNRPTLIAKKLWYFLDRKYYKRYIRTIKKKLDYFSQKKHTLKYKLLLPLL